MPKQIDSSFSLTGWGDFSCAFLSTPHVGTSVPSGDYNCCGRLLHFSVPSRPVHVSGVRLPAVTTMLVQEASRLEQG